MTGTSGRGAARGRLFAAAALLFLGAFPLSSAQAQTQGQIPAQGPAQSPPPTLQTPKSYPGWVARPVAAARGPVVEEAVLVCNGPECAGAALSCVTFHGPGPGLHRRTDLVMLGNGLPTGQISLWAMTKFIGERGDLFGEKPAIKGPPPPMTYRPDRQSNYPYIVTTGRLETKKQPARITVALWAGEDTLYGVRCAALDDSDDRAEKQVRRLIAALLADAG